MAWVCVFDHCAHLCFTADLGGQVIKDSSLEHVFQDHPIETTLLDRGQMSALQKSVA